MFESATSAERFLITFVPMKQTFAGPGLTVNPEFPSFAAQLWPAAQTYASPLNPIFLCGLLHFDQLRSQPHWLVRDGAAPLHFFFQTHPTPATLHSRLFIHEGLQGLVPESWRSKVGTYRLEQPHRRRRTAQVIMTGLLVSGYDDLAQVAPSSLERIARNPLRKLRPYAFLPSARLDRPATTDEPKTPPRWAAALGKYFDSPVTPWAWPRVTKQISYTDFSLVEINSRLIYADGFFNHILLNRGASLLTPRKSRTGEKYVALSPHHGMAVHAKIDTSRWSAERERLLSTVELAQSSANFQWHDLMRPWRVPQKPK